MTTKIKVLEFFALIQSDINITNQKAKKKF